MIFDFCCGYANDIITTSDGAVYNGRIIKENKKSILIQSDDGEIFSINKNQIKKMQMTEKWGLGEHVEIDKTPNKPKPPLKKAVPKPKEKKEKNVDAVSKYFPLKKGNWWVYSVNYSPYSLDGKPIEKTQYSLKFFVEEIHKRFNFLKKSQPVFRMTAFKIENKQILEKKVLFIKKFENNPDKSFIMIGEDEGVNYEPDNFSRFLPLNPFLKYNKTWTDVSFKEGVKIKSHNEIKVIEEVNTKAGVFDNCLLIEKTEEPENNPMKTKFYFWFAPNVGLVKIKQEIIYPDKNKNINKFVFKEYDLTDYGV